MVALVQAQNGVRDMSPHTVIDGRRYRGKYVALKSFSDKTVVASGSKPDKVIKIALKGGIKEPVIVYIPKGDTPCIYIEGN